MASVGGPQSHAGFPPSTNSRVLWFIRFSLYTNDSQVCLNSRNLSPEPTAPPQHLLDGPLYLELPSAPQTQQVHNGTYGFSQTCPPFFRISTEGNTIHPRTLESSLIVHSSHQFYPRSSLTSEPSSPSMQLLTEVRTLIPSQLVFPFSKPLSTGLINSAI